jgi:hypothetical protein
MNYRLLQTLLVGLCLTGLAAGCAATPLANNTQRPVSATTSPAVPPASTSSSTATASSSVALGSTSPPTNGTGTSSGWSTYTDPNGAYSFQYPASLGTLGNPRYYPDGTTLTWHNIDMYVYIGSADALELQWELTHLHMIHQETISVHGLIGIVAGTLYTVSGRDGQDELAFFPVIVKSVPTTYDEIELDGGYAGEPLPPFWRQMLNSFRIMAPL